MKITILSFGIAKDIVGKRFLEWEVQEGAVVGDLRASLSHQFPQLTDLSALRVAVNNEYADEGDLLRENDEIALIPPVSGG